MELTSVACNHCGAALQVAESARFVTCRYCNSQLEVKRTESAISTEVLHRIDANTSAMAEDLHVLRRESEIERLDREWNQRAASLMVRDKRGRTSEPSAAGGVFVAVIMGGFGLIWTVGAYAITGAMESSPLGDFGPLRIAHVVFPLFGVLFVLMAIGMGIKTLISAGKYEEEKRRYALRREELVGRRGDGEG